MIHTAEWSGILPIVSVPFNADYTVDIQGFQSTLEFINNTNSFGMVLFGIASEFYKLSDREKDLLVETFSRFTTTKKKIVSITDHSTYLAAQKAKTYSNLDIDGLMVLPPFFLNPSKAQIVEHIRAILLETTLPIIIQIAPNETGVNYSAQELTELHALYPNIIFKIEGSPLPIDLISHVRAHNPSMVIYNGYAGIYMYDMLELGCHGIMPGCSFVEIYHTIYQLYAAHKHDEAKATHTNISRYIKKWMTHCEYIIAVEKYILQKRGVIAHDVCRTPTYVLTAQDKKEIEEFNIIINNKEELC